MKYQQPTAVYCRRNVLRERQKDLPYKEWRSLFYFAFVTTFYVVRQHMFLLDTVSGT